MKISPALMALAAPLLTGLCALDAADNPTNLPPLPVTVRVDLNKSPALIPSDFEGFSFETSLLLPDASGKRYFDPSNQALLTLFRTLRIGSLRIGGNMGDRDFKTAPSEADIDSLFAFAKAAGVKVIYCLRLYGADPAGDATVAKYISGKYPELLECFSIGQEPSAYPAEKVDSRRSDERMGAGNERYPYASYATNWGRFRDAVLVAVPDAKFAGPGVHKETEWPLRFLADYGKNGHVTLLTAHLYPGGAGGRVPVPEVGRDRMLSGEFETTYQKVATLIPAAASNNLPFRLEEANNFYNGGSEDASDTFASSLWGLDFLGWWASRGAAGVNFHTGNGVAAGDHFVHCKYTAFYATPEGCTVQPLGYGIKAFALGASGRIVPVEFKSSDPGLRAYASLDQGILRLTLINRTYGAIARTFDVTLDLPGVKGPAESLALLSHGGDVAAKEGITIGGGGILRDGTWEGKWSPLLPRGKDRLQLLLSPASAMIVQVPVDAAAR
jgi:hypothetical protein